MDITKLHIGQKLQMHSGSILKEVEVDVLTGTHIEVGFIEDGRGLLIIFTKDGKQIGCRGTYGEFMPEPVGTEYGVWELVDSI